MLWNHCKDFYFIFLKGVLLLFTVLIVTDAQDGFVQVRKVFKCKERAQSSHIEGVLFCQIKAKRVGRKKGECIRGHRFRASHSECQRERETEE